MDNIRASPHTYASALEQGARHNTGGRCPSEICLGSNAPWQVVYGRFRANGLAVDNPDRPAT